MSTEIVTRLSFLTTTSSILLCVRRLYMHEIRLTPRVSGPEIWNVETGHLTHQGKAATIDDAFLDGKSPRGSGANTPVRSRLGTPSASKAGTPIASKAGTPVASGTEDANSPQSIPKKKKKLTRNQLKAQEERRR